MPANDGFGRSGHPAPILKDRLDTEPPSGPIRVDSGQTEPAGAPPAPFDLRSGRELTPTILGSAQHPRRPMTGSPTAQDRDPRFTTGPVRTEAAVFVDPAEAAQVWREGPAHAPQASAGPGLGMLVTGIFIGASLAIVGGMLALMLA